MNKFCVNILIIVSVTKFVSAERFHKLYERDISTPEVVGKSNLKDSMSWLSSTLAPPRVLNENYETQWLSNRLKYYLQLLFDSNGVNDEGRKNKNKMDKGGMMMYPTMAAMMFVPIFFKVVVALVAKALIVGKIALIISALMFMQKAPTNSSSENTVFHQLN